MSTVWDARHWSIADADLKDPTLPLITIGILNYNRCDDLRQTLDVITRGIRYPSIEIIVIDNGSTDGSIQMLAHEFPNVLSYEVQQNNGVSSRNIVTRLAKGKYVFHFDNDSNPATPATIFRVVKYLESHSEIDAISMSCYQPLTGITETEGWNNYRLRKKSEHAFEGIFVVEGGSCFRLDSLKKVQGYDEKWTYGSEGIDLGLQFFKNGLKICLCPEFLTLHFFSSNMRPSDRRAYMNSRHMIWLIAKHWPLLALPILIMILISRRVIALLMHKGTWRANLRGLKDGLKDIGYFLNARPKLTWRQVIELRRFYFFLFRWA